MRTLVGDAVCFGRSGNSLDHVVTGWSEREAEHTWSTGAYSSLWMDVPRAPFGFLVEIDWHPALFPPIITRQIVRVEINGRSLKSFSIERRGFFAFLCPPIPDNETRMVVTFHYGTAFRPSDVSSSRDKRVLAICFRQLRLLVLQEPWRATLGELSATRITAIDPAGMRAQAEVFSSVSHDALLHRFEMLAGNCDMGLALRNLGFEKLSLLRFGGATVGTTIKGLANDFDGIGQRISLSIADNPMKEWMVIDETGLLFHSGQSSLEVDREVVRRKFPAHLQFMRRKLLEDLDEGEKIFVYSDHKDYANGRAIEEVLPLYLALRRRSKASMLWVCPSANDPRVKGAVREVLPGLALGYLDLVAPPVLIGGGMTVSGWLTVLCNAWLTFIGASEKG